MEVVSVDEREKLNPEQWVNVYGIIFSRCEYLNTCQVYQLEMVLSHPDGWFENIVLELVDESEQPISLEEGMKSFAISD